MTERVLLDARVRAWVVREAGDTACYLGIQFRNAPQLTVRAAVQPSSAQVVGASGPAPEDIVAFVAGRVNPQTAATQALANGSRADKLAYWGALSKSQRDALTTFYRFRPSGVSKALAGPVAQLLKAAASVAPGGSAAVSSVLARANQSDLAGTKAINSLIDIGSAVASGNPTDAAKARAAGAAAAVLQMPSVTRQLAAHGVTAASMKKTSDALNAASKAVRAKMAPAGSMLSRLEDAAATSLIRQANPKLSTAAARQQLRQFVYLKVNQ